MPISNDPFDPPGDTTKLEPFPETLEAMAARHARERALLERVETLATGMDAAFTIPGTSIPIGWDTVIGLVPVAGDTVSLGIAGYIASHGTVLGARKRHFAAMGGNIFVDWLIGLIPGLGDILDVGWRGNLRNAALLRKLAEARWERERAAAGIIDG